LDFDTSAIHVRQSVWHGKVQTVKTKESENSVPMTPLVRQKLRTHLANHNHVLLLASIGVPYRVAWASFSEVIMSIPKNRAVMSASFFSIAAISLVSLAAAGSRRRTAAQSGEIQRGKYLVEEVAKCPECHTPRDANGNLDPQAWLQGAPIWIMPVRHIANWADNVPAIAGLPSFTDEQMERVLEKGIGPQGEVLRPPMHIYHMTPADAKAIIVYLKSLPTKKS